MGKYLLEIRPNRWKKKNITANNPPPPYFFCHFLKNIVCAYKICKYWQIYSDTCVVSRTIPRKKRKFFWITLNVLNFVWYFSFHGVFIGIETSLWACSSWVGRSVRWSVCRNFLKGREVYFRAPIAAHVFFSKYTRFIKKRPSARMSINGRFY